MEAEHTSTFICVFVATDHARILLKDSMEITRFPTTNTSTQTNTDATDYTDYSITLLHFWQAQ